MKSMKRLDRAVVLTLAALMLVAGQVSPSLAQTGRQRRDSTRKPACGCFCGNPKAPDFFEFGIEDCAGILAADACGDYLNNNATPEMRRSACNQTYNRRVGQIKFCPVVAGLCKSNNYCGGNMPERGCLFFQNPTARSGKIHPEPSTDSPALVWVPNGTRLCYQKTMQINGQTWHYVTPPGKPAGWVPGSELSCTRPGEPPPIRVSNPKYPDFRPGEYPTAAEVAGARG